MRWLLAILGGLFIATAASAEIDVSDVTPEDKILNTSAANDKVGGNDRVTFVFQADATGAITIRVEANGNTTSGHSVDYSEENVTQTVEITVDEIRAVNTNLDDFDLTVELAVDAVTSTGSGTEAVESSSTETEVTNILGFVVDGERPGPVRLDADELTLEISGDGAVIVSWSPSVSYTTEASDTENNVEEFWVLSATQPLSDAITIVDGSLTESGSLNAAEIANYDSVTIDKIAGSLRSTQLEGLANDVTLYVSIQAVDHAGNASLISVDSAGQALSEFIVPLDTATFSETLGIDNRCFIVTAAFGDVSAPWVDAYRFFRDGFLLKLPLGKALVQFYYQKSPYYAQKLTEHPTLQKAVKWLFLAGSPVVIVLGATGPFALLFLMLPWLWRRQSGTLLMLVSVALLPTQSDAIEFIKPGIEHIQTATLQVGQMQPNRVDGQTANGLRFSYLDIYGKRGAFPFTAAYQWTPFQLLGDWGFQVGGGLAVDKGKTLNVDATSDEDLKTTETSKFIWLPANAGVAYRGRWFKNQPILIGGNAGVDFWSFIEKGGSASKRTRNFVYGWHVQGEVALLLDWIEKSASMHLLEDFGIEDTLLFAGWQHTQLDDFGSLKTADFTHSDWIAGIRFVF